MKPEINNYKLDAVFVETKDHCIHAKDHDFIEAHRWHNGDGYTIEINNSIGHQVIQVTEGEFKVIKKLIKKLDNG